MSKVTIITNIPNPYRIPLFNCLNEKLAQNGLDLLVLFAAKGYKRRKWKVNMDLADFNYLYLKPRSIKLGHSEKVLFLYNGLYKKICKYKPKLIVVGGFSLATLKLWILSLFKKFPYVIWSGAIVTKGRKDSAIRRWYRKILISRSSGFVAYSTRAKQYLQNLGADPDKIEIAINSTDVEYFAKQTHSWRATASKNTSPTLLYVGHLTYKKRIDLAFMALKRLIALFPDIKMIIVGDGPYRSSLQELCENLKISRYVHFEGFKQMKEIPQYYAKSDCFLFPSEYDVWGLVLVEAMAAGLPCISSIHAGATQDLIKNGETGFQLDFEDTGKLVDQIAWILNNPHKAAKIGHNAAEFILNYVSIEKSAVGFLNAIKNNLNH